MTKYTHCISCKEGFSASNVYSRDGWLETQISGMCELCFDLMCAEIENLEDEDDDLHD